MQTIGGIVRDCLESFDSVLSDRPEPEEVAGSSLVLSKIKNEQDKFKVWSGNIGAHRVGASSLDYRLRDASNLRNEVSSLLEDLLQALADANTILDGEVQPWEEDDPPDNCSGQQEDLGTDGFDFASELEQLLADIVETVNYLYKVSASLRSTSQHDHLMSSLSINMTHYEVFDIEHVRNKHPNIENEIAQRLGKDISMRRHYFKYRESHRDKLGSGMEASDKVTDGKSTIASSLPEALAKGEAVVCHLDIDDNSESGFTQTSFATSIADSTQLRIPPLPKGATTQEYFECPFCFMILSAQTRRAWKKHLFADLRPYVCLYQGCPTPTHIFARRHQWVEHLRQQHWRMWKCPFEKLDAFASRDTFMAHVQQNHRNAISADQMDTFMTACERPSSEFANQECMFCEELISSSQQYQKHIGRHLEQIALFALPTYYDADEDGETEREGDIDQDHGKESTSSDSDTGPEDQQSVPPRLSSRPGDPPLRPNPQMYLRCCECNDTRTIFQKNRYGRWVCGMCGHSRETTCGCRE
ncbi:hypothetical protein PGQ11_014949 [Apiospora arundinis]|uniref:C2H2-type domain-containing protein n=1 Tax=Apiospora arundinis TaxID=335852 RepID=A0ABR2HKQ8_9PEZI